MACRLCGRLLPLKDVEALNADIDVGDLTLEEIGERYNVDAEYVDVHQKKCHKKKPRNGYELLMTLLETLQQTATEMRQAYDPEDNPYAMGHFVKLAKEVRETVMALDKMQPSTVLLAKITETILNPLVREFAQILVEEAGRTRGDLFKALGDAHTQTIDQATKTLTKRMADRFQSKTAALVPQLKKLLEDEFGRAKTKSKKGTKSDRKAKSHLH